MKRYFRCGHSKPLGPEFVKLADAAAEIPVIIGQVDATKQSSLGQRYSITGYPTLLFFAPGSTAATRYKGARDAATLAAFINTHTGLNIDVPMPVRAVTTLTAANFDQIVGVEQHVLVVFKAAWYVVVYTDYTFAACTYLLTYHHIFLISN